MVDEFIILDDVQFTSRDWRNRNLLKTPTGLKWITIPVKIKGNYKSKINEIEVTDHQWTNTHWDQIKNLYVNAPCFNQFSSLFENIYSKIKETSLSKINCIFIAEINNLLSIQTKISHSTDYDSHGNSNEKLISLCKSSGAESYLSGPAAKNYLDESMFKKEGIRIEWMDYDNYPEYKQLYPPFSHGVSILDLLFNEGQNAAKFMKSFIS